MDAEFKIYSGNSIAFTLMMRASVRGWWPHRGHHPRTEG